MFDFYDIFFSLRCADFGYLVLKSLLTDSSLSDMVPGLTDLQLDGKAQSTVLKYKSGWLRWCQWALSEIGVPVIPCISHCLSLNKQSVRLGITSAYLL